MEDNGYTPFIHSGNLLNFTTTENDKPALFVVDTSANVIVKYILDKSKSKTQSNIAVDIPFTKKELRFFDSLDYNVNSILYGNKKSGLLLLQNITDWTDM